MYTKNTVLNMTDTGIRYTCNAPLDKYCLPCPHIKRFCRKYDISCAAMSGITTSGLLIVPVGFESLAEVAVLICSKGHQGMSMEN